MNTIVRGISDSQGDVYFYVGYDFQINKEAESQFFSHLDELVEKIDLKPSAKVFGGMIKQEPGKIWPARKDYGTISEIYKSKM